MGKADHSITVLVVDDDQGLRRLMEKALRRDGFGTAAAATAGEALEWLKLHPESLALVDLKLPDMSGAELVRQLVSQKAPIPFIIITGQGDERVAVEMMKQGALDYLIKDSRLLEILPSVVGRAIVRLEDKRRLVELENALRRSEANLAKAQELLHLGSFELDLGSPKQDYWSAEVFRILGLNHEGGTMSLEKFLHSAVHPADRSRVTHDFNESMSHAVPFRIEFRISRPDGSIRHILGTGEPMVDGQKMVTKLVGTLLDITDRKLLEREVSEISELEQRRIGQDLHDGLCQHLAGIEFMGQVLHQRLAEKSKPDADAAADIAKLVRQAITQTRDLARGMSPVMLETDGLMSALQELAANTNRVFSIKCVFKCEKPVLLNNNTVATHLYRIAQEAVNNAIKHGRAKAITIKLKMAGERAVLAVHDDGAGLPTSSRKSGGMGLRIMQYRAGIIGGTLAVQREAGGGTSVICSLQLAPNPDPSGKTL